MGDLYFDDIEDRFCTDEMILSEVEALVKSGQREETVIDYKSDVSEQNNRPQTVAAFANSFGGLCFRSRRQQRSTTSSHGLRIQRA
jgi:hypothetical protein